METPRHSLREQRVAAIEDLFLHRRETTRFTTEPVPRDVIDVSLSLAAQAPSDFNFQPWRFLVLTKPERRQSLREASGRDVRVFEAPVLVVAFGERDGWKSKIPQIWAIQAERTGETDSNICQIAKHRSFETIATLKPVGWLHGQVMIGFTYLMLTVESLGWNTACIQDFDAPAVRTALELPEDAEIVAILAIGRAAEPQPPHPGRLPVSEIAHLERFGEALVPFNQSES